MQPGIEFLTPDLIDRIFDEAFQLLAQTGVKVLLPEARSLLAGGGATVDETYEIVTIPEKVARQTLETVPHEFYLHNSAGEPVVHYGGHSVHFDPGSSGVNILNAETHEHYSAQTHDLVNIIKIAESLPQYDAQSTAVVCHDFPQEIGDIYRLYLVLLYSTKPIVTGAFSTRTTQAMIDVLAIFAGGRASLAEKPQAVFDVCPTPPLTWTPFAAQNVIDLARAGVPAEIVPVPLAGIAAPVTLLGSIVQHTAECISGIAIHQLAQPGSPLVWGGAPAIMDMRRGTTPMGAIETAMLNAACTQVGKSLGFPTHGYLGASDAKLVDAQAGIESGMSALVGALAGINMISGAGMLDFLACHSPEKLVVDAEVIGMVKRMLAGITARTESLALAMFEGIDFKGNFLEQDLTRQLFREEHFLPSNVMDRGSLRHWQETGKLDTFERARIRTQELLKSYQRPDLPEEKLSELHGMVTRLAAEAGMDTLPDLE